MKLKFFSVIAFILSIIVFPWDSSAKAGSEGPLKLIMFVSSSCHECTKVKNEFMPDIEKKYQGRIRFEYLDINDMENYKLFIGLKEKYDVRDSLHVPIAFFKGYFLSGGTEVRNGLQRLLDTQLEKTPVKKNGEVSVDLLSIFRSFTPLAIISLGLVDGVNPCAFTVIVFFISFLTMQGYARKELIAIGLCYIFAVFMTYLLIGLGGFTFLYNINKFWLITKVVSISIGVFSIVLGFLAVFDFFKFKKTGKTEGLALQLPKKVKDQIHKVVGLHYRVDKRQEDGVKKKHFIRLIISALVTGFLVSLLEAVCTGQTYLPTITFILKTTPFKLRAAGFLVLYNLMFVVPLFVVFIFALFGITSEQFSHFLKKNLLTIKILMAIMFFGMGIFLIWRA